MKLDPLEAAVLEKLLDGNEFFRRQLPGLSVKTRELTGVGFYTTLEVTTVPAGAAPASQTMFGDVIATIDGLPHGAGFQLYIEGGLLHVLEGYSHDGPWPDHIGTFSLEYGSTTLRGRDL